MSMNRGRCRGRIRHVPMLSQILHRAGAGEEVGVWTRRNGTEDEYLNVIEFFVTAPLISESDYQAAVAQIFGDGAGAVLLAAEDIGVALVHDALKTK